MGLGAMGSARARSRLRLVDERAHREPALAALLSVTAVDAVPRETPAPVRTPGRRNAWDSLLYCAAECLPRESQPERGPRDRRRHPDRARAFADRTGQAGEPAHARRAAAELRQPFHRALSEGGVSMASRRAAVGVVAAGPLPARRSGRAIARSSGGRPEEWPCRMGEPGVPELVAAA